MVPNVEDVVQQAVQKYRDKLTFVDVSDAEGAKSGQGHAYFLSSPLVSSDMLMTLQHDLTAEERGLTRCENLPVYSFPEDYIQRLWEALKIRDPDLIYPGQIFNLPDDAAEEQ